VASVMRMGRSLSSCQDENGDRAGFLGLERVEKSLN
jgi:hypothetical protein